MQLSARLPVWIEQLATRGVLPDDSDEVRLRKATLTLTSVIIIVLATMWTGIYGLLGLWLAAMIPLAYQVLSFITLLTFFRTRRVRLFAFSQFFLMLWLPFLLQWSIGGFVAAGGVMLWALISPLGALMCAGPRQSIPWFAAFLGLTAITGLLDPTLSTRAVAIPEPVDTIFFVMNAIGPTTTAYLVLLYSVRGREQARADLDVKHQQLLEEQDRAERLLLNVLPQPIADRLKAGQTNIADGFPEASVLFADLVNFTPLAERLSADDIVSMLNDLFSSFDDLAERHGLEKIKTVGDGYMLAGGLPEPRPDHPEAVAEMALAMQNVVAEGAERLGWHLSLRIGIDTGPVVAGVIGKRKFSYDVWGDTVNTASRMASHGQFGCIQITERTYERVRHRYRCERRGLLDIKGKGRMNVYILIEPHHP